MPYPSSGDRRAFLRKASVAALAVTGLPQLLHASNTHLSKKQSLPKGSTVLFQGDSITDAGRHRDQYYPNQASGMGTGYVHHIVTELLGKHPAHELQCYNRGISGNKVYQLADRWEDDCLHLEPAMLSILIGVNDFWHTLNGAYDGTVEIYERDFRQLLDRTKEALPEVRLVIGEPFAVAGGRAITDDWSPAFNGYRKAAKSVAEDYEAVFIPYQSVFDEALKTAPADYWCPDGVHPSLAGVYLMSRAWLEGVHAAFDF